MKKSRIDPLFSRALDKYNALLSERDELRAIELQFIEKMSKLRAEADMLSDKLTKINMQVHVTQAESYNVRNSLSNKDNQIRKAEYSITRCKRKNKCSNLLNGTCGYYHSPEEREIYEKILQEKLENEARDRNFKEGAIDNELYKVKYIEIGMIIKEVFTEYSIPDELIAIIRDYRVPKPEPLCMLFPYTLFKCPSKEHSLGTHYCLDIPDYLYDLAKRVTCQLCKNPINYYGEWVAVCDRMEKCALLHRKCCWAFGLSDEKDNKRQFIKKDIIICSSSLSNKEKTHIFDANSYICYPGFCSSSSSDRHMKNKENEKNKENDIKEISEIK